MSSGTSYFRMESLDPEIVRVWFDVPDRPVNVLSERVFEDLHRVLDRIEAGESLKWVVIQSPKPKGFCAGADLKRLATLRDEREIDAFLRCGQEAFDHLARMAVATVAVIHGACLGGGLEFALACRHRLAVDEPSTQLGLPEKRLGLIPGWGGTQRLPRLIGEKTALDLLWNGESVDARKAAALGLTDGVLAPDELRLDRLSARLGSLPADPDRSPPRRDPLVGAQPATVSGTAAQLAAAKLVHLKAADPRVGLALERELFRELMATAEARTVLDEFLRRRGSN